MPAALAERIPDAHAITVRMPLHRRSGIPEFAHFQAGDLELVGHLGGTAGFQGFVLIHPTTGIAASGYVNRYGDLGGLIIPVLDAIARIE